MKGLGVNYSNLVKTCEEIWDKIREVYLDVPEAVIVVGTGGTRAKNLYGHFAKEAWKDSDDNDIHEVLLVAEHLTRPAEEVFTTLLHEAVHGIAATRDIKECSGKRHNKKFAALCMEVGMIPPEKPDKSLGFSAATLGPEALLMFDSEINKLKSALILYRDLKLVEKKPNKTLWAAECDCGRKVRLGKRDMRLLVEGYGETELARMTCTLCNTDFQLVDEYELV